MQSKRRILHFIDSGGLYGAESVILNLSREMIAHGEYEPVIGCIVKNKGENSDLLAKARELGILAVKIPIRNFVLFYDLPRAGLLLGKMQIRLIHCHGYKAYVFAFLIRCLTRIPIVSTCHLWFLDGTVPLKMRLMVKFELFLYRFSRLTVAVSEPIKEFLVTSGISRNTVKVINNGIRVEDCETIDENKATKLRKDLGIENGDMVILNVGRLTPQKAQGVIIDAARILRRSGKPWKVLIAGDGELREELEKQINREELEGTVMLLGFRKDIKELLQISNVFLLPSLDEGMPICLLEAVASRTPVIATAVGDVSKLIRHEESGHIIPMNDAEAIARVVARLESNRKICDTQVATAYNILKEKYSSTRMYFQYEKCVYHKLVYR